MENQTKTQYLTTLDTFLARNDSKTMNDKPLLRMKTYLMISLLLVTLTANAHDIRLAIFEISEPSSGNHLLLNASIDIEELGRSLLEAYPDYINSSTAEQEKKIIAYITKNLQITIGQQLTKIKNVSINYDGEFVKVKADISDVTTPIRRIYIENTCLIESNRGHSNIIKCKLYGKLRSFRLTEDRISTVIEY